MSASLIVIAWVSLAVAVACACVIALHLLAGHRQHMWIMNVVWPVTALYAGPLALWAYFRWGRLSSQRAMMSAKRRGENPPARQKPFWQMVALGATHCGSGCTLGDIAAETFLVFVPLTVLGRPIFAAWTLDYGLALLFGIAFQ
jgi:hypothetical protein